MIKKQLDRIERRQESRQESPQQIRRPATAALVRSDGESIGNAIRLIGIIGRKRRGHIRIDAPRCTGRRKNMAVERKRQVIDIRCTFFPDGETDDILWFEKSVGRTGIHLRDNPDFGKFMRIVGRTGASRQQQDGSQNKEMFHDANRKKNFCSLRKPPYKYNPKIRFCNSSHSRISIRKSLSDIIGPFLNKPFSDSRFRSFGCDSDKKSLCFSAEALGKMVSRGDWIRTSDHTPPRRVL